MSGGGGCMETAIYPTGKHGFAVILLQDPFSHHWGGPLPILTPLEVLCGGNKGSGCLVSCDPEKKKGKNWGLYATGNQLRDQKVKHGFLT